MCLYRVEDALEEVKLITPAARMHLQHIIGNGLQNIMSSAELGKTGEIKQMVKDLRAEFENLGI